MLHKNFQFIYGLALLLIIPATLVINTVLFINHTERVLDIQLERQANLAASLIGEQLQGYLSDQDSLQAAVEKITQNNSEVYSLDVLIPEKDNFKVIASLEPTVIGKLSSYSYNSLAWSQGEAIAYKTTSQARSSELQTEIGDQQFWTITRPLTDLDNNKIGLVSLKISTQVISDLVQQNYSRSLIIVAIGTLVIVLLLINNLRLFQVAVRYHKLEEVDRMKDEFISMASHELRAPIVGLRGYLMMLADRSFGELPKLAGEKVKLLLVETNRLGDLVEDLLEVSRIQQGRIELDIKSFDFKALADGIISNFEPTAIKKNS